MKKICVITGASSGIGKEFFKEIAEDKSFSFDEYWVIARTASRLEELKALTNTPVRVIALDLSKESSFEEYKKLLEEESPRVSLLVNCSGYGKFDSTMKVGYDVDRHESLLSKKWGIFPSEFSHIQRDFDQQYYCLPISTRLGDRI